MQGDKAIIEAILQGNNSKVLNTLYERSLPKIQGFILRNGGNHDDVKDVFQDAVIAFIKKVKLREFDETQDIDGYIYVIGRNLWINKAKVAQRYSLVDEFSQETSDGKDHLDEYIHEERQSAILDLVTHVKEPCATLLRYTIFLEMSLKEVAEKMKYSSAHTAKIYNYRCKKRLMKIIEETPSFQVLLGRRV